MEVKAVEDSINAAFPELPVPDPKTLIRYLERRDPSGEEAIRGKLAGQNWRSLSPKFLAEEWASFVYLSAEAYRYYLPALLAGALQEFTEDSDLLHTVICELTPLDWFVYEDGDDPLFRDQQSALTPDQYLAVAAFLGLVFDHLPRYRQRAAFALHWGWNRIETPALIAVNQRYHELRSYTYPESTDPRIAALCREIAMAFADTPYPGDDQLCGSMGYDTAEYAVELRGVRWQSAHPELLAQKSIALILLTAPGFRYFLPAFLWADLLRSETGFPAKADPRNVLIYGLDTQGDDLGKERGYSIRRFADFTRAERIAIIHYLEFQAQDEYQASKINEALESYWRPSVQGQ